MLRRRDIAAAPHRRADEAWAAIVLLIADTLDRSDTIDRAEVVAAFAAVDAVGTRLVAGRHLEKRPVVLVADPVHLSIYTVSGAEALKLEENLAPVPGGGSVSAWKVYLPAPAPLDDQVAAAVAGSTHLSVEDPPAEMVKARAESGGLIDLDALTKRLREDGH
ncbi:MAG: hypothetical protein QOI86_4963 [Actinomycetota bacterium]|jgi:hypothetical protein|nr:hypothetical protein [Actinomycetota bacterium]